MDANNALSCASQLSWIQSLDFAAIDHIVAVASGASEVKELALSTMDGLCKTVAAYGKSNCPDHVQDFSLPRIMHEREQCETMKKKFLFSSSKINCTEISGPNLERLEKYKSEDCNRLSDRIEGNRRAVMSAEAMDYLEKAGPFVTPFTASQPIKLRLAELYQQIFYHARKGCDAAVKEQL